MYSMREISRLTLVSFVLTGSALCASEPAEPIDLFDAMKAGELKVQLIPKDSKSGTVIFANQTIRPLKIKLPDAFAGVPVQAQFGAAGAGGGLGVGGGNNGASSLNQGLGGGFGGGGGIGGGGFGGGGGGFFNVGPEKTVKLKIVSVCLEHGKKDPNPRVAYELKPIASFTQDSSVIELVGMLGRGEIDQTAAQAAAWHLASGLSFPELAAKIAAKHIDGQTEPYFTAAELERAQYFVRDAQHRTASADRDRSKSDSASESVQD